MKSDLSTNRGGISVVLVEDHEVTRQGIRAILAGLDDVRVVGETDSAPSAINLVNQVHPDVVVLDILLRQGTGMDVSRAVNRNVPAPKILVFTAHSDDRYVGALVKLGVNGFLLKTASAEQIVGAIHEVAKGKFVFPDTIDGKDTAIRETDGLATQKLGNWGLTRREAEVLECLNRGLRNYDIAQALGVSEKTVEAHVRHIFIKLGVSSRSQAALKARATD